MYMDKQEGDDELPGTPEITSVDAGKPGLPKTFARTYTGLGKTLNWASGKTCIDTAEAVPDPSRQIKTVRHHLRDAYARLKAAGR